MDEQVQARPLPGAPVVHVEHLVYDRQEPGEHDEQADRRGNVWKVEHIVIELRERTLRSAEIIVDKIHSPDTQQRPLRHLALC